MDNEPWVELESAQAKYAYNKSDVNMCGEMTVGSKITNVKGTGSLVVHKVYTRNIDRTDQILNGKDVRATIIMKLADPDATNGQQERYSIDNCWYNDLPLVTYEKGGLIEEEATGGFTPSDMVNLDAISA